MEEIAFRANQVATLEKLRQDLIREGHEVDGLKAKQTVNKDAISELQYGNIDPKEPLWVCGGNFYLSLPAGKAQMLLQRNNHEVGQQLARSTEKYKKLDADFRTAVEQRLGK